MRFILLSTFLALWLFPAHSQTVANSIFTEYGYPNIPKDSTTIMTMYGYSKFRVYADDKFVTVEAYQDLPEEELGALGAGLRSVFFKERISGDVYIGVALDTMRIRMKGGEKEQESFREMTQAFNSGAAAIYGKGHKALKILGYDCQEYLVNGILQDTVSSYLTSQIVLGKAVKDFPLNVSFGDQDFGLILGRDEVLWNGYVLQFRAVKVEINRPRNIDKELTSYKLVTEEEGDKMIQDWFSRLMEMPVEGKN